MICPRCHSEEIFVSGQFQVSRLHMFHSSHYIMLSSLNRKGGSPPQDGKPQAHKAPCPAFRCSCWGGRAELLSWGKAGWGVHSQANGGDQQEALGPWWGIKQEAKSLSYTREESREELALLPMLPDGNALAEVKEV